MAAIILIAIYAAAIVAAIVKSLKEWRKNV